VIEDGQKDEDPFQHTDQRQAVEKPDLSPVGRRPLQRVEVRDKVLKKKGAERDDAQQRMQLVPKKRCTLAGAKRSDSAANGGCGRGLSSCHDGVGS
jgi:hypothetical protein